MQPEPKETQTRHEARMAFLWLLQRGARGKLPPFVWVGVPPKFTKICALPMGTLVNGNMD